MTYTAAQQRTIDVALELFARRGVAGTSLQMIADDLGVTKAAVYHQFNTKDEIVLAVAEAELARLEAVVAAAEREADVRGALVAGIVDLAIEHRRTMSAILSDPVIVRFFAKHDPFRQVMDRMNRALVGPDAGPDARASVAMLTAAISGAVIHPMVVDLDDETLRTQLLKLARGFLEIES